MGFDVRNIGKQQLDKQDYAYIKVNDTSYDSDEVMESKLHGSIKTSYQNIGEVRLVIKHTDPVDEEKRGSRTRQVHSMYIEDSTKQRTRIPFNYLSGARAFAQHVNQGGDINDEMGQHIHEMIQEVVDLKKFVKAFKRADNFADESAYEIIEQARERALGLTATLKTISGPKGYKGYVEQYEPTDESIEQADLDDIRNKLIRIEKDNIVDSVLPSLARGIKQMNIKENNVAALANSNEPIELLPNPEEDQEIKNYLQFVKKLKASGRKTSEEPMDGLVNRVILTIAKRGDDELGNELARIDIANPQDKVTAYKLAVKYLQGKVKIIEPKAKKTLKKTEEQQLEDWANNIVEGTWAVPNTDQDVETFKKLMTNPLPLGPEGDNATNAISAVFGDDTLFDDLYEAGEKDPEADARPIIAKWVFKFVPTFRIDSDVRSGIYDVARNFEATSESTKIEEGGVKDMYIDVEDGMSKEEFLKTYPASGDTYDEIKKEIEDKMNEGDLDMRGNLEDELEDDYNKEELEKEFSALLKAAGIKNEGETEDLLMKKGIKDLKNKMDNPKKDDEDADDELKAMLKKAGFNVEEDYNSELSAMANSMDKVERTYAEVVKADAEESEVGDYIGRGMTKDQILKLIDMLEPQGYDKDFLLKDLAPMMEAEIEEGSIKYMYRLKDKGMSDEEIAKELGMTADEVKQAMNKTEALEEDSGDKVMFKGKEIDTDTIEYDMQDYSDLIFALEDGVKYTDGTPVADEDYNDLHEEYDLIEWVRIDYMDRVAPQAESLQERDDDVLFKVKDAEGDIYKIVKYMGKLQAFDDDPDSEMGGGMGPYIYDEKTSTIQDIPGKDADLKVTKITSEDHSKYPDSQKIASKDDVEVFAYDHGADTSAVEVYVDGKEVASGYIDVQAGDIVVDGTSFKNVQELVDEYVSAFAEQKAFEEKMFKLAGLK
jgi:biotin operon repressor